VSSSPLDGLRELVLATARELDARAGMDEALSARAGIALERPPRADLGDYSTNAALMLAPRLGAAPREVAERIATALEGRLGADLERFEIAGPGFVNLYLADAWLAGALLQVLDAADSYGAGRAAVAERVLLEFVSANPTGPMHVGHARNAAYGDALARLLTFHGHSVEREFYVNDAGSQVRKLGESVIALARGVEPPEDGYRGDYVRDLVHLVPAREDDAVAVGRAAVAEMVTHMRASLAAFGVPPFDHWTYETELHDGDPSPVARALALLEQRDQTYHSDGALWLRLTAHGEDKDRVLVRSNGEYTYFATDIAYHQLRRERGYDREIDVWGADHHGHVPGMKAAYEALGGDPERLEMLIMQLVHLVSGGERAQMSKRAGEFVTLDDLVAEIGVDAARWYLLSRSHDTTVDLDLELARRETNENPVYYVQYAHARVSSVLAKAGSDRIERALAQAPSTAPQIALHPSERALIKQLIAFPLELAAAAERRAPHRIAAYVLELSQSFTAFYRDCRVVGAEPEATESLRLALSLASKRTVARCLDLLGVRAPEEM
jgi:arginyl-tRNA synthetase